MVIISVKPRQAVALLVTIHKTTVTSAVTSNLACYSRLHYSKVANSHRKQQPQPQPQRPHTTTKSAGLIHTTTSSPTAKGLFRRTLTKSTRMASDSDYMDFLNKANEDPNQGSVSAQQSKGKKELKAADHGAEIPQPLVAATQDAFYVSDADEPFVPVSLAWQKGEGLPDEGMSHFSLLWRSTVAPSLHLS